MSLVKVTDATVEPITLTEAKQHLLETLSETANDAYISALITAARTEAEHRLQRTLLETTWRLKLDAFPCEPILLPMSRVIEITELTYIDSNGDEQTLDEDDYILDADSEPGRLVPAYGTYWPVTRDQPGAVSITYTAGYGTAATSVPRPIKQWMLLAIGDLYQNRAGTNVGNIVTEFKFADSLLDAYRIWGG